LSAIKQEEDVKEHSTYNRYTKLGNSISQKQVALKK